MSPRLTLEEIGRRAGVSRSTVSRVINGHADVSTDVEERVRRVVQETGYRPHAAARSLASSRTGLLGLIVPSAVETLFDDPYFGRLMLGATRAANVEDRTIALLIDEPGHEHGSIIPRVGNPGLVDGFVVTATRVDEPLYDQLLTAGMPFVVVGRPLDPRVLASVDVDNHGGAVAAVEHLVALGRRRFALVAAPTNNTAALDRTQGFLDAVAAAGLAADARVGEGDWSSASAEAVMQRLLADRPDAVFVASDRMAVGAMRAIAAAGLRCPQDVAVVGFDGLLDADRTRPSLTTVAQPVSSVGDRAVRLLCEILDGDADLPQHVVLPTELVVRETCGATRARTG